MTSTTHLLPLRNGCVYDMGFPKFGVPFSGSHNKISVFWGRYGVPLFWELPYATRPMQARQKVPSAYSRAALKSQVRVICCTTEDPKYQNWSRCSFVKRTRITKKYVGNGSCSAEHESTSNQALETQFATLSN